MGKYANDFAQILTPESTEEIHADAAVVFIEHVDTFVHLRASVALWQ